jgi:hypothetical protein
MMRRDIQADRAIVKAATEGPWKGHELGKQAPSVCVVLGPMTCRPLVKSLAPDWRENNANVEFIALARTAIPYYMDAYEQAEARAVKAERELELLAQEYVKNKPCFRPVEEGKDPAQDIIDQFKAKAMAPEAFKFCLTCGGCGKPLSCAVYQELARKENLLGRVTSEENTR